MITTTRAAILFLFAGSLAASIAAPAVSARGDSSVLTIAPSIRSAGTGGASGATFWGGDPDAWANPALLGYHQGVRFDAGNTEMVASSGLAFQTARWSAAFGGIGVMGSGTPRHLSRTELADDVLPGTPGRIAQRIDTWGAGISLAEAISSVMGLAGAAPPALFSQLDVAAGAARHELAVDLAPQAPSSARTTDYGVVVRWTPLNTLDPRRTAAPESSAPEAWRWPQANDPARRKRVRDPRAGIFPDLRPVRRQEPRRFDLAYGYSVKNAGRSALENPLGASQPLARIVRHGVSASIAQGRPRGRAPWLSRAFTPLYAAGIVGDLERVDPGDGTGGDDVTRYGAEATFANVFTLRRGRVKDAASGIDGTTSGYSVGFNFGYVAGVRYDRARVPQAKGQPEIERRGFTAWVDPLVMLRAARSLSRSPRN